MARETIDVDKAIEAMDCDLQFRNQPALTYARFMNDIKAMVEDQKISCPVCGSIWPIRNCEHAIAICKRGKCIGCIADAKERIEMEPYEFETDEWDDERDGSVVFVDVLGPSQTKNPDEMKTTYEEMQRVITELHCGLGIPRELIEQSDSGNYSEARVRKLGSP